MKSVYISSLILVTVLSAVIFGSRNAIAHGQAPDLSVLLERQIALMNNGGSQSLPTKAAADDEGFFLRRFWFRVRPKATFSIPGLVKIQVIPEVEMLWERPLPEGYAGYKR